MNEKLRQEALRQLAETQALVASLRSAQLSALDAYHVMRIFLAKYPLEADMAQVLTETHVTGDCEDGSGDPAAMFMWGEAVAQFMAGEREE